MRYLAAYKSAICLNFHDVLIQRNEDNDHHCEKVLSLVPKLDAYMYQLKTNSAIAPCDESFRTFVVQDFSEESFFLKVKC